MKSSTLLTAFVIAGFSCSTFAQDRIELQSDTTILNVLQNSTGKTVELHLDSGDKIGGKVEALNENVIHLSHLTTADLLDAFVDVESISAVVVRGSGK
jgi:small nuclear ribonucleoprotein (snRNP)-like protein